MVKRVKLGYRWVDFDELAPEEKKAITDSTSKRKAAKTKEGKNALSKTLKTNSR